MRLANLFVVGKELAVGLESGLVRVFNMALPYPSSTIVWRSISQGISISSLNWNEYDSVASKEELVSGLLLRIVTATRNLHSYGVLS